MTSFDVELFRQQFPFFQHNPQWVYLDNAATMHKPSVVSDAVTQFYQRNNSNVHRAAHQLSQQATATFEHARADIASFINAASTDEIIFTAGATSALNQIAYGLMHTVLQPGDRVLLTVLEHHANIVSWQLHCQRHGIIVDVVPLLDDHTLDLQAFTELLRFNPKVVAISHVSNALGHVQPIAMMIQQAKAAGALTVIDGAQGIVFDRIDVQQLDADFYVFSGHKLYGPTGIGVLYGKKRWLEQLTPLLGGGEMIDQVSFVNTTFNKLPFRLEAGTPNIAGAIGLSAAVNWLQKFNLEQIKQHKLLLLKEFYEGLLAIKAVDIYSSPVHNAGIVAFNVRGEHPSDVATLLSEQNIAVRAGQHCAMPLFEAMSLPGALRCSFAAYNSQADIKKCLTAIKQAIEILTA